MMISPPSLPRAGVMAVPGRPSRQGLVFFNRLVSQRARACRRGGRRAPTGASATSWHTHWHGDVFEGWHGMLSKQISVEIQACVVCLRMCVFCECTCHCLCMCRSVAHVMPGILSYQLYLSFQLPICL